MFAYALSLMGEEDDAFLGGFLGLSEKCNRHHHLTSL